MIRLGPVMFGQVRYMCVTDPIASRVLVDDPPGQRVAPVLHQIRLRVLLALAVTEPPLRLRHGDQVIPTQVHLQELSHVAADLGFGAPRAAVQLLPYPVCRVTR